MIDDVSFWLVYSQYACKIEATPQNYLILERHGGEMRREAITDFHVLLLLRYKLTDCVLEIKVFWYKMCK